MAVFAVNILGRSDEPMGRAEVMVAEDEGILRREFSAFLTAASAIILTADADRVAAELAAEGWAMPVITQGSQTRLYRCLPLPGSGAESSADDTRPASVESGVWG